MSKLIVFILLVMGLTTVGCGKKSAIKNAVEAKTMAQAYGDGNHVIRPFILPLSDQELSSFDSPVANIGFLFGGFAKLFMDFGASMGLGRSQISVVQPLPEIPEDYFKGLKIKRIFFYIEPKKGERRRGIFERLFNGRGNVDFNFVDKLVVKLSSSKLEEKTSWKPVVDLKNLSALDWLPIRKMFERSDDIYSTVIESEKVKELVLLKFDNSERERYLKNDKYGHIYFINTKNPAKTRRFLADHPKLKGYFKRIHILNKSVLVELDKDPVVEEGFKNVLAESAAELEGFGVSMIEPCNKTTCMDLKIQDVNLLPLIMKGNAIKLDAFIDAGEVPESFQLKGFIEFELKLKLSF